MLRQDEDQLAASSRPLPLCELMGRYTFLVVFTSVCVVVSLLVKYGEKKGWW